MGRVGRYSGGIGCCPCRLTKMMKQTTDEIRAAKLHLWKLLKAIPADHPEQNADLYEALKTDPVIRQSVKDKGA